MWLHLQKKSCESFSNERKCILVQDQLGPAGQKIYDSLDWFERVRTMYYDYKLMFGTKLERVVSPECNENVASRNLKNECKKPEETAPAETAIMQTKIRQVPRKDNLFKVYLINSRKNDSHNGPQCSIQKLWKVGQMSHVTF